MEEHSGRKGVIIGIVLVILLGITGAAWYWYATTSSRSEAPQALSPEEELRQRLDALKGDAGTMPSAEEVERKLRVLSATGDAAAPASTTVITTLEELK